MMKSFTFTLLLTLLSTLLLPATAHPEASRLYISQGPHTQLLELYTSQGCSSCPPADRWLSQWQHDPRLWQQVVPVAFHVDYWDWIGWQDAFATPAYGQRQRNYKQSGAIKSVYTPGFVLDGREWRGWFSGGSLPPATTKKGTLTTRIADQRMTVQYQAQSLPGNLIVHVALLGFDLQTKIMAGENTQLNLHEDFVVLWHQTADQSQPWEFQMPDKNTLPTRQLGFAAWIIQAGHPQPVQVVGGMF